MKQIVSDKYTIAWFKIAECVARGEKERALGVYRLLSHSLDDHAFARQLEADIILACGDAAFALQKYYEAADLYIKDKRPERARAIYEHLIDRYPSSSSDIREQLIILYDADRDSDKINQHRLFLVHAYGEKRDYARISNLLDQIPDAQSRDFLLLALLEGHGDTDQCARLIEKYMKKD